MQAKKVYEDDLTIGLLDIYPAKKGHVTFMLKEHYPIMPYIPAHEFKHLFGKLAAFSGSVKKAMVATGSNVFIANGGAAGQQAPHFLIYVFPRENDDGFFNFWLNKRNETTPAQAGSMLANNFPIMMGNHFKRNPASWHSGVGVRPEYLLDVNGKVIYEDEKVLCVLPEKAVVKGHIEIYSKDEEKDLEKLDEESSAHLFYAASFAATAVFEGLGAQATNIIAKSGKSDDTDGKLVVHILPRAMEDGLNNELLWQPKQPNYDLDQIASRIKDATWKIAHKDTGSTLKKVVIPQTMKISEKQEETEEERIRKAIEDAQR